MALSENVRRAYVKNRRDGMRAKAALSYAQYLAAPLPYPDIELSDSWSDSVALRDDAGHFTGFTFRARMRHDDSADYSWLGEFTGDADGAIKRDNVGRGEFGYIKLADWRTEAAQYASLRGCNLGKAEARRLAREYAAKDIARLEKIGSGDEPLFGVVVEVCRKGVRLGSASLWGIDDSYPFEYARRNILPELVEESLQEARDTLAGLCECDKESAA